MEFSYTFTIPGNNISGMSELQSNFDAIMFSTLGVESHNVEVSYIQTSPDSPVQMTYTISDENNKGAIMSEGPFNGVVLDMVMEVPALKSIQIGNLFLIVEKILKLSLNLFLFFCLLVQTLVENFELESLLIEFIQISDD